MSRLSLAPTAITQNGPPRAVLYLRVSTPGQVKTDYDPEGISIPAQRKACERKAAQLDALVVDEYIEPGRSATSMAKRPVFQAMLARIRDQGDVQYVIVYKLSRMNRNRFDDAWVVMELRQYGATLVSATENFDDTPIGQAMHGMTAVFNQLRSAEDGEDIRYKMGEKAKRGGTLGRAKLGYLNVRETLEDGREVRTVAIDPERGKFITLAFELYATGDYTLEDLQASLTDRGLTTRPGRHPAGPVSVSKLASLLRDRYYLGYVTYKGVEYPGRHEPLVTPELFERVQLVLDAKATAGERPRVHHHYLKGSIWCWRCHDEDDRESRMIVNKATGNGGEYFYFFCRATKEHSCSAPYWDMDEVEDAVLRHYANRRLEPAFVDLVRSQLQDTLADRHQATKLLEQQLTTQLARLDRQEENLLDLAADGDLPQAKIRQRLHRLAEQRARLQAQQADLGTQIDTGVALLEAGLDLLDKPQAFYRQLDDQGRRLLNQAIFEKLYVGPHGIEGDVIREPFRQLVTVQRARRANRVIDLRHNEQEATDVASRESLTDLLATAIHSGSGSNRAVMVALTAHLSSPPYAFRRLCEQDVRGLLHHKGGAEARRPARSSTASPIQRRLKPEQIAELVTSYQAGSTVRELATAFGIDRKRVYTHLKRQGVTLRQFGPTAADVDQAARLYGEGWPLVRIGKEFGVSGNTVGNWLRKAGVVLRSPRGGGRRQG